MSFESMGHSESERQSLEMIPISSNEVQILLMKQWADENKVSYVTKNDLVMEWIASGYSLKYRSYIDAHPGNINLNDSVSLGELLRLIDIETRH